MEKIKFLNRFFKPLGLKILKYQTSNSEDLRLKNIFRNNDINFVIDVGANVGKYGQMLIDFGYDNKIVSFEPLKAPYEILKKKSLRYDNWIVPPRMAIGDSKGQIEVNISKNIDSSSVLNMLSDHVMAAPESQYIGVEKVMMNSLDNLSEYFADYQNNNIFLKIDVQGFEFQVLKGADNLLKYIKGIQLELSLVPLYDKQKLYREIIDYLENFGFKLFAIIPGFSNESSGQTLQFDGIFLKI